MKPKIRPWGILKYTTLASILALNSCDDGVTHVFSKEDQMVAEAETTLDQIEKGAGVFTDGRIPKNTYIQNLGYYHPDAATFYPHPYGDEKDGKFYINGNWETEDKPCTLNKSAPNVATIALMSDLLKKQVEMEEIPVDENNTSSIMPYCAGAGSAVLLYWALNNNSSWRNQPDIKPILTQAKEKEEEWQKSGSIARPHIESYHSSHPTFSNAVCANRGRANPSHVAAGRSTTRGGFGGFGRSGGVHSFGG